MLLKRYRTWHQNPAGEISVKKPITVGRLSDRTGGSFGMLNLLEADPLRVNPFLSARPQRGGWLQDVALAHGEKLARPDHILFRLNARF